MPLGESAAQPKGRAAAPSVTPDYLQRLLSIIEQDPMTLGCPFSNWTAPLLAEYLAQETGIRLDESRIRHYMHAHNYKLLRPVLTVASPDPEYDSKRTRIEDLQRQAEAGTIDLNYEDEIDVALLPTITHCWCKRGHQRKSETPRKNQKHSGAGLIHWVSGKLYWATSDRHPITLCSARYSLKCLSHPTVFPGVRPTWWSIPIGSMLPNPFLLCWPGTPTGSSS